MFLDSLDIANKACQHLGVGKILTVDEDSRNNSEMSFVYDKMRRAELRRNVWTFATRRVILHALTDTTYELAPKQWDAAVTYLPGAIVADENGTLWISNQPDNVGYDPNTTTVWDRYFGPMTVDLWLENNSYMAGDLVYKPTSPTGAFAIFMSLQNQNSDDPMTATAWDATTIFKRGDVVLSGGSMWRSLIELNQGITPADAPLAFDISSTYSTGQQVTASDGFIYTSLHDNNTGHDPVFDGGSQWTATNTAAAWSRTPSIYPTSKKWRAIFAGMNNLQFTYPVGAGPQTQTDTKNVFRLPAGYLRVASQDPKAGSNSIWGAPTGLRYRDWLIEGKYLISGDPGPIVFRFVADVTRVAEFDDMFCEGLACRLALETCLPLTQSTDKKAGVKDDYKKFMGEARMTNAIEAGAEEAPEDDFIACRV